MICNTRWTVLYHFGLRLNQHLLNARYALGTAPPAFISTILYNFLRGLVSHSKNNRSFRVRQSGQPPGPCYLLTVGCCKLPKCLSLSFLIWNTEVVIAISEMCCGEFRDITSKKIPKPSPQVASKGYLINYPHLIREVNWGSRWLEGHRILKIENWVSRGM